MYPVVYCLLCILWHGVLPMVMVVVASWCNLQSRTAGWSNMNRGSKEVAVTCYQMVYLLFFRDSVTIYIFRRLRKIAKSEYDLRHVYPTVCPSTWNNSAPTGRIFMKYDIWVFFNSVEKIKVSLKFLKNNGYFTWRPMHIYDHISPSSSYSENVSNKIVEKI
jgi:hypothetical protein